MNITQKILGLLGRKYIWVLDCGDQHICKVTKLPNGDYIGNIVNNTFIINKSGKIKGGYNITDWQPLNWTLHKGKIE